MARGRSVPRRVTLITAVLVVLGVAAPRSVSGDVIFHVPEVLVRHAAAPRPVGTGRPSVNATRNNDSAPRDPNNEQYRYEYYIEHSISTADAKKMARMLKLSDFDNPKLVAGCGVCSKRELEYCETKVIADHCCCEQRFTTEPFPWLPHTCYLGPERCQPLAGNCVAYARLRDCCCQRRLAEHWKCILSKSARLSASGIALMVLSAVLVSIYL